MTGLIIKDFLNLKKQVLPMLLFLVLYFIISLITKNSSFFTGVIMIFCAMLPITALSYDDRAGFARYAVTMPVSRDTLVVSKYVMSIILLGFGSAFAFLNNILIGSFTLTENLFSVIVTLLLGSMLVSISLPSIFKFGVEKGRFIMFGILVIFGLAGSFASMGICKGKVSMNIDNNGFSLGSELDAFLSSNLSFIVILAFCTIIFLISMGLSISIYRKKDF